MTVEEFERALRCSTIGRWRSSRTPSTRCWARPARRPTSAGRRGDRDPRSAAGGALVRRRRALLARAQRERARTQRRGVDRHRARGEAADQRRRAEARRPDRLPPAASSSVSRAKFDESRKRNPKRLRDRLLPRRRARRAARLGRARRRCCARRPLPARANELRLHEGDRDIRASNDPPDAPGEEDRAARAVHRQGRAATSRPRGSTSRSRTTTCRSRRKRGSTPKRSSTTSSSASARRKSSRRLSKSP